MQNNENIQMENNLDFSKKEIQQILNKAEIESAYIDMIYTRGMIVTGDENWLRNITFCEDSNKKTADLLFAFSKDIDNVFKAFDNKKDPESLKLLTNSFLSFSLIFESINISLITNIYRELYRNVNGIGAKNKEFIDLIENNLKELKEAIKDYKIKDSEAETDIENIKIDKNLFEKHDDRTIFFFIIKPLLLSFKEGALINLEQNIVSHKQRVKELSNFIESNDKFYNFMCADKNQNLSERIIIANASKTFNDLHYTKFDENVIKGLFALNPEISELYNSLITQAVIEELNLEILLKDVVDIKKFKKIIVDVFNYEMELSEKYDFPDILFSDEYLIMTDPEKGEISAVNKMRLFSEFLTLNDFDYDKTFEDIKVVIEFTVKKYLEELKKAEEEEKSIEKSNNN